MTQRKTAHLNAIKHGLFAQQDLLEGEDPLEYKRFMESVIADMKPTNALQQTLAVRIAGIYWRLARIPRYESSLFTWRYKGDAIETLERLSLYETRLSRLAERLTKELQQMKEDAAPSDPPAKSKNEKTKSVPTTGKNRVATKPTVRSARRPSVGAPTAPPAVATAARSRAFMRGAASNAGVRA